MLVFFSRSSRSIAYTRSDDRDRCPTALVWFNLDIYPSFRTATYSSSRHAVSSFVETTGESQSCHCRSPHERHGHSFEAASHDCISSDHSSVSSSKYGPKSECQEVFIGSAFMETRSSDTFVRFEYILDEKSRH